MYSHIEFAPVKTINVSSYEELRGELNKFDYSSTPVDLQQVSVDNNGTLVLGGENYNITQQGFIHFCKLLRIPDPFANYIPWDLLQTNINRLVNYTNVGAQFFLNERGQIINVARENFIPVDHEVLIDALQEKTPEVSRLILSDIRLEIDTTKPIFNEDHGDIKLNAGDAIKTGLNLVNSTTGFNHPVARLFLYTLVCANGMIAPSEMGYAKMRLRPNRDLKVSIDNFVFQLSNLGFDLDSLTNKLNSMTEAKVQADNYNKYWKGIQKIVQDVDYVDERIFETDDESRKFIQAQVRAFKKDKTDELPITDITQYKLFNNITSHAQNFDQFARRQMEIYAGKILHEA